jgi:uncharacterized cupin superfamily protein
MDVHKVDWSAMEWKQIRKGVEQKAFSGSGATVALHRLMPGHEPKPHSHPHEQIAYIISGRMRFHIGQETHDIGPGGPIRLMNSGCVRTKIRNDHDQTDTMLKDASRRKFDSRANSASFVTIVLPKTKAFGNGANRSPGILY